MSLLHKCACVSCHRFQKGHLEHRMWQELMDIPSAAHRMGDKYGGLDQFYCLGVAAHIGISG